MIGRLTGKIIEKTAEGTVLLDVGGVGFEVRVPPSALAALKGAPAETTLFIHLAVREDALTLYGFTDKAQLLVFKLLLGVKNIGPKNAMGILSTMKPEEVASALSREDVARFSAVPGIGRKTSQMIIVELKDKIRKAHLEVPADAEPLGKPLQEVASALMHLGFRPPAVQKTLEGMRDMEARGAGIEEMIREALAKLAR
jgi:Holliday junction DNA helicase RuvA